MTEAQLIESYLANNQSGLVVDTITNNAYIPMRISGVGVAKRLDEQASAAKLTNAVKSVHTSEAEEGLVEAGEDLSKLYKLAMRLGLQPDNFLRYTLYDRDSSFIDYLDEWNGVPVNLMHSESKEYIIGEILKAYVYNSQIWGIVRMPCENLEYLKYIKSTSPGVISEVNKPALTDSAIMPIRLIKESFVKPLHLSLVPSGFWDLDGVKAIDLDSFKLIQLDEVRMLENDKIKTEEQVEQLIQESPKLESQESLDTEKVEDSMEQVEPTNNEAKAEDSNPIEAIVGVVAETLAEQEELTPEVVEQATEEASEEATRVVTEEVTEAISEVVDILTEDELEDSLETQLDADRESIMKEFRSKATALDLKVPFIAGRQHPGAVISKILAANSEKVSSKYAGLIADSSKNYELLKDALSDLLSKAEVEAKKASQPKFGEWQQLRSGVRVQKDF